MESIGTIEIRVQGVRGSEELSPRNFDISDLRETLSRVESLLFPIGIKGRPLVTYEMQEGSVKHIFRTSMQYAVMLGAVLTQITETGSLDFLELNTAKALEAFQEEAYRKNLAWTISTSATPDMPLSISRETHYRRSESLLAPAEFFLYGKVTMLGGKNKGTIHIDTDEFGNLTVESSKKLLGELEKNYLYHVLGIHASGLQNPLTSEIDRGSLVFREFLKYDPRRNESYLRSLIDKARKSWSDVEDVDSWIQDIRGYANA
jgi:hypothetical protein